MPPRRNSGFFTAQPRPEDEAARQREVESLLAPRRTRIQDIPIDRIRPNPFQARVTFLGLEDLRDAILAQGFTSRLRVRPDPVTPDVFQLVYGERRLRAARLAGLEQIPCEIAEHTDDELLEIGLAENIQRQDLNPLEEARAFETFIRERGYSIRGLAERIGKDKGYVENRLNLLQMPGDVQQMVEQRPDSLIAAREIAKVDAQALRAPIIAQVAEGTLSTTGVRAVVRDLTSPPEAAGDMSVLAVPGQVRAGEAAPPAPQPRGPQPPSASGLPRLIRREAAQIRGMLERWERLARSEPGARATIEPAVGELIDVIERVAEAMRSRRE